MKNDKKINNFVEFINENDKFAFDDEIKYELKRYLKNTIWDKVGTIDKRVDELIEIHNKFIDNVRDKMSANEIAERLFKYEKNIIK